MDNPLFLHFVTLLVFSLMFAIGMNYSLEQLTSVWRHPAMLLRSLVAVVVVVPVVVFLVIRLFDVPSVVATGLAILAAAPGAPMMTKRTEGAGGELTYAASLQLTLALLAVALTPLILSIFYLLCDQVTEQVGPAEVAFQISRVTFFPVIIGMLIRRFAPRFADRVAGPFGVFANVMFLVFVLLIIAFLVLSAELRAMLNLGVGPLSAILVVIVAALATGHTMGGPAQESRSVLAIACIARNVGLALYIASLSDYERQFVPTLITYVLSGSVLAIPYSVWSKRRLKPTQPQTKEDGSD